MQSAREPIEFLPDFCTGARVLRVLVVCEAVAIVLALGGSLTDELPLRFLLLSIYLQWIGVCSAAALCLIKRYASPLSARGMALLAYLVLLLVTLSITEITYVAGRYSGFALLLEDASHDGFLARSVGICAVVAALALRYFWLRSAWQNHSQAEVRAKLEALQARIEPHFLFNSLNSVAALIAVRPADAETALEDLALLLRARLSEQGPADVTLAEEMTLVDAYVGIESLRLGERLCLDIDISNTARRCRLPALSLQPLVENAIGHGVARLPQGGTVAITANRRGNALVLEVSNPLAGDAAAVPGNRQALANIRNRLALRYGDAAVLRVDEQADCFTVAMIVPQIAEPKDSSKQR
jgi:two-component system sensor histidine kinase AlgZ